MTPGEKTCPRRGYIPIAVCHRHCALVASLQLRRQGHDVLGEASATRVDPALLMDVMEKREIIESSSSKEELERMASKNKVDVEALQRQLSEAFQANDLDRAAELTVSLQYYLKIGNEIEDQLYSLTM